MSHLNRSQLEALAFRARQHVIRMATDGGCFLGASLSCTDLFVFLYGRFLDLTPERIADPTRDYVFLSKGHDVPALYAVLAELGYFAPARLGNHLKPNDAFYWHPNRRVPGVEFHSGSLGHLLSVGMGVAYDIKLSGGTNRVVVVLGDGELNEGSIWEALLVAHAYRLDNLILVVDRNEFQANIRTEALIPLEPLAAKFEAFGCHSTTVDGHDFAQLEAAFGALESGSGRPTVIIAKTTRGKGLPSLEARADRWFCNFTADEIEQLLEELAGGAEAAVTSEALVVR